MKHLEAKNVVFKNYNGQDNLYFEVDVNLNELLKSTPVYNNSKVFYKGTKDEGTLWVKIFEGGIATFGFTMKADPRHGNKEYTWSSNADCINKEFELIGTPYELARYGAGVKEADSSGCYWAAELTKALALEIGEENADKLHWGIEQYRLTVDTSAPYVDGRERN
jgi:hypothetical protein